MTAECVPCATVEWQLSVLVAAVCILLWATIAHTHHAVPFTASTKHQEQEVNKQRLPPMSDDEPMPFILEDMPPSPSPSPPPQPLMAISSSSGATLRSTSNSSISVSSESFQRAPGTCGTCGCETANLDQHMRRKHGHRKRDPDNHKEDKVECEGCRRMISKSNISTHRKRCKGSGDAA